LIEHLISCIYVFIVRLLKNTHSEVNIIKIRNAHRSHVTCLIEYTQEIFISCSFDGSIKIWNITIDEHRCIRTIYVHSNKVPSITLNETKTSIISVGDYNTICITSLKESTRLEKDDIQRWSMSRISLFS